METTEFKKIFDELAQQNGFQKAHGGWFIQSPECILVLDLQKSNYGNYYMLNIKIYIQGCLGQNYLINKFLIKRDTGDIFRREPTEFSEFFNLEIDMKLAQRKEGLANFFINFLIPYSHNAMTREGITRLAQNQEMFILPAVQQDLGITISES